MRKDACGFTISELVVVSSVIAIVALWALPSFTALVADHRRAAAVNELVAALNHARHASIMDRRTVVVCASADGAHCDGDWTGGWITFTEPSGWNRSQPVPDDEIMHRSGAVHRSLTVTASRARFHFRPFSRRSTNGSVVFCNEDAGARVAVVSWSGRVRTSRTLPDWGERHCRGP